MKEAGLAYYRWRSHMEDNSGLPAKGQVCEKILDDPAWLTFLLNIDTWMGGEKSTKETFRLTHKIQRNNRCYLDQ